MNFIEPLYRLSGKFYFTRAANRVSFSDWKTRLQKSGQHIQQQLEKLADKEFNRRVLSHIIGIERWSQRRLRVALGEPLVIDEYNNYRPARDADWQTLKSEFAQTRQTTLDLIDQLSKTSLDDSLLIPHNMYGYLSPRGWLKYMLTHSNIELKKMR